VSDAEAVNSLLMRYFEGLYRSDTALLASVFHPRALYASATSGELVALDMATYFPVVDARPSPASRSEARHDRILSVEFHGPVTALARLECRIAPRHFTDLLSLVKVEGRWSIIAKVFHYEVVP
jgi:hypothetical protein